MKFETGFFWFCVAVALLGVGLLVLAATLHIYFIWGGVVGLVGGTYCAATMWLLERGRCNGQRFRLERRLTEAPTKAELREAARLTTEKWYERAMELKVRVAELEVENRALKDEVK